MTCMVCDDGKTRSIGRHYVLMQNCFWLMQLTQITNTLKNAVWKRLIYRY
jgi:hypothetical protein